MKERVGSSARDGDEEGGTNDVNATSILGSRLGRLDGFGCSPSGMPYLMYLLKKATGMVKLTVSRSSCISADLLRGVCRHC